MADMRAERTRGYLRDAVMALLREKPFEELTVREVCQQAQVSKNSFYNHYTALTDLVQDCYLQQIVYFRQPMKRLRDYACRHDACTETLDERAHLLEFFRADPNLARVILENVCISPYFDSCRHAEEALLLDHLETEYGEPTCAWRSNENLARYIVWGMFGHTRKWFKSGMREPIEAVVKEEVYYALSSTACMAGRPIEPEYLQAIEDWRWEEYRKD